MSNRKQQLLTLAIVLFVVVSCFCEQVNAGRRRGSSRRRSSHRRLKNVNIEIYHPKGVMVWYPYRAGMELFGIEIFINRASSDSSGSSSEEETGASCDICLNTTEVSYGKFILRSDDAIIRSRDHVRYNAIVKKTTRDEAYISRSYEFYVSEGRILFGDIAGGRGACDDRAAVVASPVNQPNAEQIVLEETELLEEILSELNQQCHASQNQTKQLLLNAETPSRYYGKELYQFVAAQLAAKLPMIEWNRTLVDTYYADNGIVFEVATIVDKLKILKLAKSLPGKPIEDQDSYQTEELSNDIESWVLE